MSEPRVVLHVGLPKSGTSFLQGTLRANAALLARHGVVMPAEEHHDLFAAVLHLTGRSQVWGRSSEAGRRVWGRVAGAAVAVGSGGTTVISSETLCLADDAQIERILTDLSGTAVHVVVTARDPARQIPAEWQEGVKHGRRSSYPKFLGTILGDARRGRRSARQRFWNAQDPVAVLDRWAARLGPDRVHVVVNPAPGAEPGELWRRFAGVLGLADVAVELPDRHLNTSLGRAQVEVLRRVNRRMVRKGNVRVYGDVVKRFYAGTILRAQEGEKVTLPPEHLAEVQQIARGWVAQITERGYPVAGDLADLVPADTQPPVSSASSSQMLQASLDATAELLREVVRLRAENRDLRTTSGTGPMRSRRRGAARVGSDGAP